MPLIRAASRSIALSKASGPSSTPPVIWPRSAILQSAAASIVDGILDVTVSTADRIATRGDHAEAGLRIEIDGVLDDVALGIEVGKDVDRGVGDEQRLGVGRHVHDEDVADPPLGAQARRLCGDAAHQFVGVQAALHQQLALARVDQLDGLCRGRLAVRGIDELEAADVEAVLGCAVSLIFAAGPTRIGLMMPASAASTTPRSELSSQGCTTMVDAAGTAFAAAIRRSYLLGDRAPLCIGCHDAHPAAPISSNRRYDAFAFGSKGATLDLLPEFRASTPNSSATRCQPSGDLTRYLGAGGQHLADRGEGRRAVRPHYPAAASGWRRAHAPGPAAA